MSMYEQFRLWDKYVSTFSYMITPFLSTSIYPVHNKTTLDAIFNGQYRLNLYNEDGEQIYTILIPESVVDKSYDTGKFENVIEWMHRKKALNERLKKEQDIFRSIRILRNNNISPEDYEILIKLKEDPQKHYIAGLSLITTRGK